MTNDERMRELARRQYSLVSRLQLTDIGFTPHGVLRAVRSGRLERISPRVFRVGGSADTPKQRAMAATLDIAGSAVALQSAAALWRLQGFALEPIHVISTRRPHRDRARVGKMHSSVCLDESDVTAVSGIPVTTPLRTLQDLAPRLHCDRLSQVCDRMLGTRLVHLEMLHALADRLPASGGRPGTRAMRQLIAARPEGYRPPESGLERRFESILERAGEAPFERQVDLGDDDGWIGRVDYVDRRCRVIVEVQSALFHGGLLDRARDAERLARLRRAGWIVVEVTDTEVWHRPAIVVARIRYARSQAHRAQAVRSPLAHQMSDSDIR